MEEEYKSKEQPTKKLNELSHRVEELERFEIQHKKIEEALKELHLLIQSRGAEIHGLRHLVEFQFQQIGNRIEYVLLRLSFKERIRELISKFRPGLLSVKKDSSTYSHKNSICIAEKENQESAIEEDKTTAHTETFAVRSMDVKLNNFCNADCFFCISHSKNMTPCIDFEGFYNIARNVHMETVEELILTGGEPTVNKDLDRILNFAYQEYPQTKIRLITNAIHMPPKLIDSLLLGNIASFNISINASNAKDYSRIMGIDKFEKVVENIRTIIEKRKRVKPLPPMVCASLVLVRQNIDNVVPFVEMGHQLGLDSVYILNASLSPEFSDSSPSKDPEALREILQQAKKVSSEKGITLGLSEGAVKIDSCADPWKKVFVDVEGTVNPCCGYDFRISCDEHLRGNLLKQDLREFWYAGLYESIRKGLTTGDPLPGCKACYKQMITEN
jgi:molybdenum cofactor biosynthesis enzyme MoaA